MNEPDRHKHSEDHPAHLTTTEARQAGPRATSFRVLIVGTFLVILAGLAIGSYFYVPTANKPPMETAPPRT